MNENVKKSVGWGLGLVPSEAEHEMIIDLAPACPPLPFDTYVYEDCSCRSTQRVSENLIERN